VSRLAALRRRLASEERGFTLIELLTGVVIGTVVTLAAFTLLDASVRAFKKSDDRVDVTQRGRQAMDLMSQQLRSQVCGALTAGGSTPPIAQATATSVSFWTDTASQRTSRTTSTDANKRLVGFSFATNNLYQLAYAGDNVGSTVTQTALLTNVTPLFGTNNVGFRYYGYNPSYDRAAASGATAELFTELTPPVAGSSLDQIVRIDVSYKAYPIGGTSSSKDSVVFSNSFNARTADPYEQKTPDC
jgi:prepilin-type N-terminal cleavage/methylation domain-containing protein